MNCPSVPLTIGPLEQTGGTEQWVAQSLDCSIESVLTGNAEQLPLILPEISKGSSRRFRIVRNVNEEAFEIKLRQVIREARSDAGPFAPISLSQIARRMGVDRKTISVAYPEIADDVVKEYLQKRSMFTKLIQSVRHHAYREAAILIAQGGQLPTRNRVLQFLDEVPVFSFGNRSACHQICLEVRADFRLQGRR